MSCQSLEFPYPILSRLFILWKMGSQFWWTPKLGGIPGIRQIRIRLGRKDRLSVKSTQIPMPVER